MFGWDATRYDSYYSNPWTIHATEVVRRRVEAAVPDYQWAYNSVAVIDRNRGALKTMVGGGGMVLEEALLRDGVGGNLGAIGWRINCFRDMVWANGGHFGLVGGAGAGPDGVYLSAVILAGGAHLYYGQLEDQLGAHPFFGLRYSEYLWDNQLRPVKEPEKHLTLGTGQAFLNWPSYVRTRALGGGRHRLVCH